jgi:hypothetical protein
MLPELSEQELKLLSEAEIKIYKKLKRAEERHSIGGHYA